MAGAAPIGNGVLHSLSRGAAPEPCGLRGCLASEACSTHSGVREGDKGRGRAQQAPQTTPVNSMQMRDTAGAPRRLASVPGQQGAAGTGQHVALGHCRLGSCTPVLGLLPGGVARIPPPRRLSHHNRPKLNHLHSVTHSPTAGGSAGSVPGGWGRSLAAKRVARGRRHLRGPSCQDSSSPPAGPAPGRNSSCSPFSPSARQAVRGERSPWRCLWGQTRPGPALLLALRAEAPAEGGTQPVQFAGQWLSGKGFPASCSARRAESSCLCGWGSAFPRF